MTRADYFGNAYNEYYPPDQKRGPVRALTEAIPDEVKKQLELQPQSQLFTVDGKSIIREKTTK